MVTSTRQTYGTQEHYIDGAFRASAAAETFESLNPATNEVLALAAAGEAQDVDLAVGGCRDNAWIHPRRALCRHGTFYRDKGLIGPNGPESFTQSRCMWSVSGEFSWEHYP